MYCTVKEIIREVLDTDVPDSECVFAVVLTRGDVRHIAQDWSLTDDELETVMQRLDDAFEYGADVSVVHGVVRELMEEKRASRQVTVPAVMLEKVMALAGSEMKRLYGVSLDIENYCTLRLFFDLSTLAGLSRRNLPEAGIRLLFQI